jgi:NitT/TauT family transport system substrate-binding protein
MRHIRSITAAALLAVAVSCIAPSANARVTGPKTRQLETVTYATSFGNFGRDAFVYAAIERGYFAAAGLDVKVVPGVGTDNARLLAAGTIDYAAGDVSGATVGIASQGYPIKAVAVTSQVSGSAIAVLADSGISSPKDLAGKKFADTAASIAHIFFDYYAKKVGLNPSSVTFVPTTPQALPGLLASGQVSAVGQFTVGGPLLAAAAGGKSIRMFPYRKVLPGLLGNALWTSTSTIQNKPDQVRRFTKALLKGLNWSVQNPGSAGYIMQKYVPLADPVVAGKELRILKNYVITKCTRKYGVGYIDVGKMKSTSSLVRGAFRPPNPFKYNELYTGGFVKTATCKLK